ncbi:COP23 domain-containing protein [Chamaesiphon sp. OTE_8_metabat_110]|uniref:COP23 domain-containing protein n=1 Tax=Chamaesiphon sp. OTE_8_metabat_110 TaxID=2964696 RepID=UPI002869FE37|nr:COP23 domain-containing protein [Chamaesiphon sp. OTE_8_metabat_110]
MLRILPWLRNCSGVLLVSTLLTIESQWLQPSQAQSTRKFSCELLSGAPTTVVKTVRGSIPMIHWVKSFTGRYNNRNQRCHEVSSRLDRFHRDGKLKFVRTGNVNTYPVLCVDEGISGNTCPKNNVLVTLPKGTDSAVVLQQLLDLRARASGRIVQLSGTQLVRYRNGDAYVSIDRLLGD